MWYDYTIVNLTTVSVVIMKSLKEISWNLRKLGLSENQAHIYLTLVQEGELRIQEIADLTKIPRSSVYENLKELFRIGLIEKLIDQKFARIKAYPIGNLKHRFNEKLHKYEVLLNDLDRIEKEIIAIQDNASPSQTTVRYYKGVSGARQLFWNSLKTKSVIYVYSFYGRSKFLGRKFYRDFVRESQEADIKERVLINPTQRALSLIKEDADSQLGRTKIKDIHYLPYTDVSIEGETFIYDDIYAQINLIADEITGFEIESRTFTKMQRSIFKMLWDNANPLSNLL